MISKEDQGGHLGNSKKVEIVNKAGIDHNSRENSSEKETETIKIKAMYAQVEMRGVLKDLKVIVKIEKEEMITNKKIRTLWIANCETIGSPRTAVRPAANVHSLFNIRGNRLRQTKVE
jgi:hypothetical protein